MRISMLSPWIKGNNSVNPKNFYAVKDPYFEFGGYVTIDECIDLYKVNEFDSGNLEDSWYKKREYIERALEIVHIDIEEEDFNIEEEDFDLDHEEKDCILSELGEPPLSSYNIYFISIYNENEERLVYIGKTDSKNSRFANGHLAALKLHNPIYNNYQKRVYFATVTFLDEDKNYIPLEYIYPLDRAREILGFTEQILINYFKPELNTREKNIKDPISTLFHIQNFTETSFLNDIFVFTGK